MNIYSMFVFPVYYLWTGWYHAPFLHQESKRRTRLHTSSFSSRRPSCHNLILARPKEERTRWAQHFCVDRHNFWHALSLCSGIFSSGGACETNPSTRPVHFSVGAGLENSVCSGSGVAFGRRCICMVSCEKGGPEKRRWVVLANSYARFPLS